ncbi:MAG: NifB/NifX family molybdenum-iron cluster-binding protein [Pseudomonadota bacterium]|uniref:NifB/NifX family molybdenum-iron cluster-binding protein n=1 Tax=Candidatus Desulfatibia profunda TaxID=2841695 RepID=A0A8J6TIF5_9BACT|nr:NifB/NifX family molybdenum-iron cluster-binding protein [Candidatus Desulfatibia profunda]
MRVAVAVWKDRISPVFDVSRDILVLDIENGIITGKHGERFASDNSAHKLTRLAELRVQKLICGAISQPLADMLTSNGIKTLSFIAGGIEEVIAAYLAGNLPNPALSMPGCCSRRRRSRREVGLGRYRKNTWDTGETTNQKDK